MDTPRELIDRLGCDAMAARLGVKRGNVSNYRIEDKLPAAWYAALCDMAGQDLPKTMFSFKGFDKAAAE